MTNLLSWRDAPVRLRNPWNRGVDDFFENFFGGFEPAPAAEREFPVRADVHENEKEYLLSFDLPGIAKEDVKVEYDKGVLTVSGERKLEHEEKTEGRIFAERQFGKFTRVFRIPETIDPDAIRADFKDGVLKLVLPKSEAARPRTIRIA